MFADPTKVHRVDFKGKWYKTQGPFTVMPSVRRRPFLFQAGQSDRGRAFAARHAEGIFSAAGCTGPSTRARRYAPISAPDPKDQGRLGRELGYPYARDSVR